MFAEGKGTKARKGPHRSICCICCPRHVPAGPQLWQTLQTRAQFQLLLPPGKMCSADYAGLLLAFQAFILDELTARGFCQVPVRACLRQGRAGWGGGAARGPGLREPPVKLKYATR